MPGNPQSRDTLRTEAFSDGVFAIAITLLVLEIPRQGLDSVPLAQRLLESWPSFFALVTSFMTILIMWINHHNMFSYFLRVDHRMMLLNGLLLLGVVVTPFTTSLVADHILAEDAGVAAGVYSGTFLLLSLAWNGLWRYSSGGHRLLEEEVTPAQVATITRQYYVAPLTYGAALVLSFFSGIASVVAVLLAAVFYAVTASLSD